MICLRAGDRVTEASLKCFKASRSPSQASYGIMASVPAHFQKLVQLVARSFYAGECPPKDEADATPQKASKKAQVRCLAPD